MLPYLRRYLMLRKDVIHHAEGKKGGNKIVRRTDNLPSPDHLDGRSADISPSRPLSSLTRSRYCSPRSEEHHQEEICRNRHTYEGDSEFGSYFERPSPSTEPIFDIKYLWNQYDTVLARLPRSNNLVEGWHNRFQTLVGCSNPTLWTFLTALKKEENLTFSKKVKMSLGEGREPKRRKWRLYDERLLSIVDYFDEYDPMDNLHCIGEMLFTS